MFTARLQQHVTNQRRDNSRTNVKLNRTASNGDYELLARVLWQVRFTDDGHERRNGHRSLRICDGAILIALTPPPGFLPAPALKSWPPASSSLSVFRATSTPRIFVANRRINDPA